MREHPATAQRLLGRLPLPAEAVAAIRHHHERYDGTGYPDCLAGDDIPLAVRMVAIADAWHAMNSDRPYRPRMSAAEARAEVRRCSGTHFCPRVATASLRLRDPVTFEAAAA